MKSKSIWLLVALLTIGLARANLAIAGPARSQAQFVPDSQLFWDNSKNWTTNFGPAYRDTILQPSQLLACFGKVAVCFHSGPLPYPCRISADGRSANCLCSVSTSFNYTLLTAILNYPVYSATVQKCGLDGAGCPRVGDAPVCKFLRRGALIPGADVISTFDPFAVSEFGTALATGPGATGTGTVTNCPKAPYAACMTAPCNLNRDGSTASCKCPVFYGKFQLPGSDAQCNLGGNLVPSASYIPLLDPDPLD